MRFKVNVSEVEALANHKIPRAAREGLVAVAAHLEEVAPYIVGGVFAQETEGEGAFPTVYAIHLIESATNIPVSVGAHGNILTLDVDLDALGGPSELIEGTHYHAKLRGGGQVELPYTGDALKHPKSARLEYFLGELIGSGLDQDTYAARVEYWASIGKAPQWFFLNYGESYMGLRPHNVIEGIEQALRAVAEPMAAQVIDAYIQRVDPTFHAIRISDELSYIPSGKGSRFFHNYMKRFVSKPDTIYG